MTEIRQFTMHHLALRLLAGSVLVSLASIAAAVVVLWPQPDPALSPVPSQVPAVRALVHVQPSPRPATGQKAPETPQKAQKPAKMANFPVFSDGQKIDLQKIGGTPPVLPSTDEDALQLVSFSDELYVLFNDRTLPRRAQLRALSRLMLLPVPPTPERLLSEQGVPLLKRPFYYGRIVDQHGQPVRYPLQAARLAERLLADSDVDEDGWRVVRVSLKGIDWTERAQPWLTPVRRLAGDQTPLVLAVMEVESGFRPDAVSRSGAVGLMQIKPDEAGRDVAGVLRQTLDHARLLEPILNLQAGITYLNLLQRRYLAGVADPLSREYLTIAAYNGGINAVLRQFGKTADAAIARINRLKPAQVYRILRHQFPRRETRLYLEKVTQAKTRYHEWVENNV